MELGKVMTMRMMEMVFSRREQQSKHSSGSLDSLSFIVTISSLEDIFVLCYFPICCWIITRRGLPVCLLQADWREVASKHNITNPAPPSRQPGCAD